MRGDADCIFVVDKRLHFSVASYKSQIHCTYKVE